MGCVSGFSYVWLMGWPRVNSGDMATEAPKGRRLVPEAPGQTFGIYDPPTISECSPDSCSSATVVAPMTLACVLCALLVLLYLFFIPRFYSKPKTERSRMRINKKAPTFLKGKNVSTAAPLLGSSLL